MQAQNVGINTTGAVADPSSMLDVSSTSSGMLAPRMTTAQRNLIPAPLEGLFIYNLDCKEFNYYNGAIWISSSLSAPYAVSAIYNGPNAFIGNWNGVGGATSYVIDVSTSPTFASFVAGYNNLNVGNVLSYNVTGLACGVFYYFRIRSANSCGLSTNSNVQSINQLCCPPYTVTSIPYVAPLGAGWTTIGLADDQISGALNIGFTFNFYCLPYTQFYISSNGFIAFNNTVGQGCCTGQLLPNVTDPNHLVAPSWTDLDPSSGGTVRYQTTGVAPNRQLHVRYTNVPFFSGPGSASTHLILYETTNVIEIYSTACNAIPGGSIVTFGIENITGTLGTSPAGRNQANFSAPNEAWRFN